MGKQSHAVFFHIGRGGVFGPKIVEKGWLAMDEPYKEMYIQLYKNIAFIQHTLRVLTGGIDDILIETKNLQLAHLEEQMLGQSQLEDHLKDTL